MVVDRSVWLWVVMVGLGGLWWAWVGLGGCGGVWVGRGECGVGVGCGWSVVHGAWGVTGHGWAWVVMGGHGWAWVVMGGHG